MRAADAPERLRNLGLAVVAFGVVVAGLVLGRSLFVPPAVAILLWNLLEAMIQGFARLQVGSYKLPRWLAIILGIATVGLGFYLVSCPGAGRRDRRRVVETIVSDLSQWLGPERAAKLKEAVAAINISSRIPKRATKSACRLRIRLL